jgi:hypothetical protein
MKLTPTICRKPGSARIAAYVDFRQLMLWIVLAVISFATPSTGCCNSDLAPFLSNGDDSTLLARRSSVMGPFFSEDVDGATTYGAIRPLFVACNDSTTDTGWVCSFYPLFSRIDYPNGYRWNIFELCVGSKSVSAIGNPITSFEIWPICWHYDNGVPEESYDGVFPIAGTLQNRLFFKRIDWFLFPAFARFEQKDHADVCVFWPIFRSRTGENTRGFAVWPLAGHFEKSDVYSDTYAIWPLFYNNYRTLPVAKGGGTAHNLGILPIYASETAPGLVSRTFVWPFFGYTTKTSPREPYHETRIFYPFIVFGKGDNIDIERCLPLFSHEFTPQKHKTWVLWPMLRVDDTRMDALEIHKELLFYFIYKNEVQTSPGRTFKARKTQVWPLFGYIDNGAGRKQFQILNPFEPLLGGNEMVRHSWTPFFALYRYERSGDEMRKSFLWDFVRCKQDGGSKDFSISLVYHKKETPGHVRWSVAKGLFSRENKDGKVLWRALWGLIGPKEDEK